MKAAFLCQGLRTPIGRCGGALAPVRPDDMIAGVIRAVRRQLGLPDDGGHVNPDGGAVAPGRPLGMSGARSALTAGIEMGQLGAGRALCSMCAVAGQGISLLPEAP